MESPSFQPEQSFEDTIASDWGQIRDDSALLNMLDSQDLEGMESFVDTDDNTGDSFCEITGSINLEG